MAVVGVGSVFWERTLKILCAGFAELEKLANAMIDDLLMVESLRRRASTKARIDVAYKFRHSNDPHQWFPVALEG
jgi:hypothetical protein